MQINPKGSKKTSAFEMIISYFPRRFIGKEKRGSSPSHLTKQVRDPNYNGMEESFTEAIPETNKISRVHEL